MVRRLISFSPAKGLDSVGMKLPLSYGLAEATATKKFRELLAQYTIEHIVPLEWCEVFVSNVNPVLLFLKKAHPPEDHKVALVHGIRILKDLDEDMGGNNLYPAAALACPGPRWHLVLEVKEHDLPLLDKMKAVPPRLTGEYGMTLRGTAEGEG